LKIIIVFVKARKFWHRNGMKRKRIYARTSIHPSVAARTTAQEKIAGKNKSVNWVYIVAISLCLLHFFVFFQKVTDINCAGVYDEMRLLEVEDPEEPAGPNLTAAAEEEELLYGSDKEGEPTGVRAVSEPGKVGGSDMEVDEETGQEESGEGG
jgi:hypothetical protein